MSDAVRLPFLHRDPARPGVSLMPYAPITFERAGRILTELGLLDTGATVNVLPWDVGLSLGLHWDALKVPVPLAGNLGAFEARAVLLDARVATLSAVRLAFAWTRAEGIPILLGQTNFFQEFDVCFHRARTYFEVRPRA